MLAPDGIGTPADLHWTIGEALGGLRAPAERPLELPARADGPVGWAAEVRETALDVLELLAMGAEGAWSCFAGVFGVFGRVRLGTPADRQG